MAIKIAGVDVINDDRELVLAKLTDINETISSTAVDVFVYDTSKDSDGGAWRHRTQHTSWYAEASSASRDVNTRSTRAEFPSVAVIVVEADKVTIYDGDDPSLPMWMVFDRTGDTQLGILTDGADQTHTAITAIKAMNGKLFSAKGLTPPNTAWGGITSWDLISEIAIKATTRTTGYVGTAHIPFSERNSITVTALTFSDPNPQLVNDTANDIAVTVLPDAPTDPATGLPVPTIAVATDGGVSVIKDDGTVVDITYGTYGTIRKIDFRSDNALTFTAGQAATTQAWVHVFHEVPISDIADAHGYAKGSSDEHYASLYNAAYNLDLQWTGTFPNNALDHFTPLAWGSSENLIRLAPNPSAPSKGMLAITTSSYNTGWMPGDIKLAALADATAETLSGSELVVASDDLVPQYLPAEWTLGIGTASVTSISSGERLWLFGVNTENLAAGTYVVQFTVGAGTSGVSGLYFNGAYLTTNMTTGTRVVTFTTDGTKGNPFFFLNAGGSLYLTDVSVRLADPDRSVKGNGLGVHGSITKTAVATGADVVAYSGFDSSNYLEQPYNADLNFGTGDFCVMGWSKTTRAIHPMFSKNNGTAYSIIFGGYSSTSFWFGTKDGSGTSSIISTSAHASGAWMHYCGVRKSGVMYLYENGVLIGTSTATARNVTQANDILAIGYDASGSGGIAGDTLYSLLRISGTAPTADQIRKIYNDERPLFQPNAKATLTGSSDAVTALAYDHDTNLLHVGTSGGRSVFQGLRRVEEHTGTNSQSLAAISAVDGLVVEGK